jgi:GDPmannose 4,6-dehydratase
VDQNGTIRVKINPKYYRPCEVDLLLGNAKKAEKKLGWKREFDTLDKLIEDMFI